jgi:hypothetical protein
MAYYFKPKRAAWFVTNNAAVLCQLSETERAVASLWTTISERKAVVIVPSLFVCLYFTVGNLLNVTPFCKVFPVFNLALRH